MEPLPHAGHGPFRGRGSVPVMPAKELPMSGALTPNDESRAAYPRGAFEAVTVRILTRNRDRQGAPAEDFQSNRDPGTGRDRRKGADVQQL